MYNGPGQPDGHMELSDGDFSLGFQLGLLYELSAKTRMGLTYRSSTDTEFSDTPELSGLSPAREALLDGGIRDAEIDLESEFPQIVAAGVYHEFGNGYSGTMDVAWIDFSEFGLTEATLGNMAVETSEAQYDDMWAVSAGYGWPINEDWTMRAGVAYVSSGVEDENRSFTFRLDRIIGVGVGVGAEYRWGSDRVLGFNLTYYDLGDGPVSQDVPLLGTLSGEYDENYALGLDISLRWIPER